MTSTISLESGNQSENTQNTSIREELHSLFTVFYLDLVAYIKNNKLH